MMARSLVTAALVSLVVPGFGSAGDQLRNERLVFEPAQMTEFPVVDCGDFTVLADFMLQESAIFHYDETGALLRLSDMRTVTESLFYNSTDPARSVAGIPRSRENVTADLVNGLLHSSGVPFMITVPGFGRIFAETGRATWDLSTGELLSNSGLNQLALQDAAVLCDFLK